MYSSLRLLHIESHFSNFRNSFLVTGELTNYRVRLTFPRGDKIAQATGYVPAPGVRANVIALVCWYEPKVREANFSFVTIPGNFKNNVSTVPLALVFNKVEIVVQHVPYDSFAWHELGDLQRATVNVVVVVIEHRSEFVGVALYCLRPPAANVINGFENFFWGLVYRKGGGVVLIIHDVVCPFSLFVKL